MIFSAELLGMTGAVLFSGGLTTGLLSLTLMLAEAGHDEAADRLLLLSTRLTGLGTAVLLAALAMYASGG